MTVEQFLQFFQAVQVGLLGNGDLIWMLLIDLISSNPHLVLFLVPFPTGLLESSNFSAVSSVLSQGGHNWTFQPILKDQPALFHQTVGHLLLLLHSYSLENTHSL